MNLGASVQNNIGMDRINVNAGLNYFITVNEVISHRLSVLTRSFHLPEIRINIMIYSKRKEILKTEFLIFMISIIQVLLI